MPRSLPAASVPKGGLPRRWQVGLVLGAVLGVAASVLGRRAGRIGRQGLVDWQTAEAIAVERLRRGPGALTSAELERTEPAYAEAMARVVPLLERHLGTALPGVVDRHEVVDRAGWARANLGTFQQLIARLEKDLLPHGSAADATLGENLTAFANRFITTRQIAFLLGYLGNRVLGQYDVALLSAEASPGRLLFVEENVRSTAAQLDVPLEDFRTWIALHETTHAFELEGHPWLRAYIADRLERQLASLIKEARSLQAEGVARFVRNLPRRGEGGALAGLLTPEQRQLLRETQLVMSLLEGFSDWVMDEVGSEIIDEVPRIRARFEARRDQRRRGIDRLIARLTGLDMKLEQYRRGERFVSGVAAAGGHDAIAHLWDGPEALPTEAEMADPIAWVRRVAPQTLSDPPRTTERPPPATQPPPTTEGPPVA
jgi:coenzyme F420 biosynthesis associated uncharacterized protein